MEIEQRNDMRMAEELHHYQLNWSVLSFAPTKFAWQSSSLSSSSSTIWHRVDGVVFMRNLVSFTVRWWCEFVACSNVRVWFNVLHTFECVASFRSPDRLYHMHGINVFIVVRFGSACAVPLLLLPYYAENMSMLPFQYVIIQWAQHNTHSRISHTNPKKAKAIHQIRRTRVRAHTHELPTSLWRKKKLSKETNSNKINIKLDVRCSAAARAHAWFVFFSMNAWINNNNNNTLWWMWPLLVCIH